MDGGEMLRLRLHRRPEQELVARRDGLVSPAILDHEHASRCIVGKAALHVRDARRTLRLPGILLARRVVERRCQEAAAFDRGHGVVGRLADAPLVAREELLGEACLRIVQGFDVALVAAERAGRRQGGQHPGPRGVPSEQSE
jgi:hypothetical protein